MVKEQRLEEFKLTNSIVSTPCSLLAFLSKDADSNVRLQYHGNIIGTVSNRKSGFIRKALFNHVYNVSLLLGRHAACQHDVSPVCDLKELLLASFEVVEEDERGASDDDRLLLLCNIFTSGYNLGCLKFHILFFEIS